MQQFRLLTSPSSSTLERGIFYSSQELLPDAQKTPNPLLVVDVCKIAVEQSLWTTFQDFPNEGLPKPQLRKDLRRLNSLISGWQSKTPNCTKLDGKITSMDEGFSSFLFPQQLNHYLSVTVLPSLWQGAAGNAQKLSNKNNINKVGWFCFVFFSFFF